MTLEVGGGTFVFGVSIRLKVFLVSLPFDICWIPLPLVIQSLMLCGGLIFQRKLSSFLGKFYWVVQTQ